MVGERVLTLQEMDRTGMGAEQFWEFIKRLARAAMA